MEREAGADESANERKMRFETEIADAVFAGAFAFFRVGQKTAMPKDQAENIFRFCSVSGVRRRINEGATNVADAIEKPAGAGQPARTPDLRKQPGEKIERGVSALRNGGSILTPEKKQREMCCV
jgi:hypothetical protein